MVSLILSARIKKNNMNERITKNEEKIENYHYGASTA